MRINQTLPSAVDLSGSWVRAWIGIGARGDGRDVFDKLVERYSEPHRRYHSLQHLGECLAAFDTVRHLAAHPDEVEIALWFHDAIYDTHRHDNEEQSAVWARRALLEAGASVEAAGRVHDLVMATRHSALPVAPGEQLLVDIDLSILGASDARFAEYERQIREEYAFVPQDVFTSERREILSGFLTRTHIYSTAYFRDALEARARKNLELAISAGG